MSDLHLGQHISRQFNEELEDVRSKVLHMGGVVEEQLANALRVMVNDESELARTVKDADDIVNSLEVEIDEECTRILVRRQPAATDLRLVMTVARQSTNWNVLAMVYMLQYINLEDRPFVTEDL